MLHQGIKLISLNYLVLICSKSFKRCLQQANQAMPHFWPLDFQYNTQYNTSKEKTEKRPNWKIQNNLNN